MRRKSKIIIYIIMLLLAISALLYELSICRNKVINDKIAYHKEVNLNYVTNLKDNKFYTSSYLNDDHNFVASLIDNFKIDYNYLYTLSESINYVLTYDVTAILEVYDSENKDKPIEKNTYEIVPKTTVSDNSQIIKVDLFNQIVDYQTYNKIIQNWKREVSPDAMLTVYFNVKWDGNLGEQSLNDNYTMDLKIPISQKTISITKSNNVSTDDMIAKKEKLSFSMKLLLISTIVMIVTILFRLVLFIIVINSRKDKFEVEINKILREFDRAITEAKGEFIIESEFNYIEVNSFLELMDVHDNLNLPIIFYRDDDSKCTFAVRDDKNIYFCEIKRKQ